MASRIDHVGVIVRDLDVARAFLHDAFGIDVETELDVPDSKLRARWLRWGDITVELIELEDPDVREGRLGAASATIDHIGVEVADLDGQLDSLRALGVRMETDQPLVLGGRRAMFLEADSTRGVRYQLLETISR